MLRRIRHLLLKLASYALVLTLGALLAFVVGDLFLSRSLPDLKPWHTLYLQNEFTASMDDGFFSWPDYLQLEERLFGELRELEQTVFLPQLDIPENRYRPGGNPMARRLQRDWNRSFVLKAENPRATALLVHGLSDSPYSMRAIGQILLASGITVYGLRMPGHGTIPSGLDNVAWQDWLAAVRIAGRHIGEQHPDLPFYYVGFSAGAAVGIKYTIDVIKESSGRLPDQMFLLSPALGVSAFARLANLQRVASRFRYFEKSRWLSVTPEYDPFKYSSFTKNAGRQISLLISEVFAGLDKLVQKGRIDKLPPITSFQSVVDQTVITLDLVDKLYGVINNPKSELILFDVNHISFFEDYLTYSTEDIAASLHEQSREHFTFTLVSNAVSRTRRVEARSWIQSDPQPVVRTLALTWPNDIYSLSHVALPFPADDPVYGYAASGASGQSLQTLGNIAVRGEKGVLRVSAGDLLRLRSNPFLPYIKQRILEKTDSDVSNADAYAIKPE